MKYSLVTMEEVMVFNVGSVLYDDGVGDGDSDVGLGVGGQSDHDSGSYGIFGGNGIEENKVVALLAVALWSKGYIVMRLRLTFKLLLF
ncbi:hypothetical protein F0562_017948 [Nyssa sinensis]|uniref:Uncharacterized protein n=1 Tax=Nyssa sinensis TaxID=561372 RepID=A0A5J4ZA04_9ASTE|nr:hypothetical protein F0562_017948 [Nyssa sinensis]